jgi:ribosomal protein S18 acetylase RimI-like enzyme
MSDGAFEIVENGTIDPAALNELWQIIGWDRDSKRTVQRTQAALDRSDFYVSAIASNSLVGFARVCGDPYIAQVLDVIVHPAYRRRGIATALMERIVGHLKRSDYISVTLIDGTEMPTFYERFGFRTLEASCPARVYRP